MALFWLQFRSPNWPVALLNLSEIRQIGLGDYSPEKAGVGGSVPSHHDSKNVWTISPVSPSPTIQPMIQCTRSVST